MPLFYFICLKVICSGPYFETENKKQKVHQQNMVYNYYIAKNVTKPRYGFDNILWVMTFISTGLLVHTNTKYHQNKF